MSASVCFLHVWLWDTFACLLVVVFFNLGRICVAKPLEIEHVDVFKVLFHTVLFYSFSSSFFIANLFMLPIFLNELCLRLFFFLVCLWPSVCTFFFLLFVYTYLTRKSICPVCSSGANIH